MKLSVPLWYLGVVAAAAALIAAFLFKSWPLSVAALALGLILQKTNSRIPLPAVYRKLGIRNDIFEGKASNEKNNK